MSWGRQAPPVALAMRVGAVRLYRWVLWVTRVSEALGPRRERAGREALVVLREPRSPHRRKCWGTSQSCSRNFGWQVHSHDSGWCFGTGSQDR